MQAKGCTLWESNFRLFVAFDDVLGSCDVENKIDEMIFQLEGSTLAKS